MFIHLQIAAFTPPQHRWVAEKGLHAVVSHFTLLPQIPVMQLLSQQYLKYHAFCHITLYCYFLNYQYKTREKYTLKLAT